MTQPAPANNNWESDNRLPANNPTGESPDWEAVRDFLNKYWIALFVAAAVILGIILGAAGVTGSDSEQPQRDPAVERTAELTGRTYSQQCRHNQRIADDLLGDGQHGFWDEVSARKHCDR